MQELTGKGHFISGEQLESDAKVIHQKISDKNSPDPLYFSINISFDFKRFKTSL